MDHSLQRRKRNQQRNPLLLKCFLLSKKLDTSVIITTTSTSVTLTITDFGLFFVPVPAGIPCEASLTKKISYEIFMSKYAEPKKQKFYLKKL